MIKGDAMLAAPQCVIITPETPQMLIGDAAPTPESTSELTLKQELGKCKIEINVRYDQRLQRIRRNFG